MAEALVLFLIIIFYALCTYTNDGFVRKYLFVQKNQSEKTISARRPCYLFALCRDGKNCKMCRNMKMLQVMILQIWISARRILLEWLQIKKGNACSSRKIGEEGKTPGEVEAQSFALLHSVNSNFLAKLESLILGSADNLAAKVTNPFASMSGSDLRSSSSISSFVILCQVVEFGWLRPISFRLIYVWLDQF